MEHFARVLQEPSDEDLSALHTMSKCNISLPNEFEEKVYTSGSSKAALTSSRLTSSFSISLIGS